MKKRAVALLLATMMGMSMTACGSQKEIEMVNPVSVSGVLPETGDVVVTTTYIGTVEPREMIDIYPMVTGKVTEMNAELGKQVTKGDVLFALDNAEASLAVEEAQKEYDTVKSTAEQAKKDAEQAEKDAEAAKKQAAETELKLLEEKMNSAKKDWDAAKKAEDDAEEDLEDYEKELDKKGDSATYSEKRKLENLEKAYETAKTATKTAETAYNTAKTNYENAKNGKTTTGTSTTTSGTGTASSSSTTSSSTSLSTMTNSVYDQQLAAAEKKLSEAKAQLALYQVTAPIDGIVEAVYLGENEKAFENESCLVLSNKANMEVTFYVPEAAARTLQVGDSVQVENNSAMNTASVTEVGLMADEETKLFKIKASLGSVTDFSTGVSVKVYAETQKASQTLMIPYDALYFQAGAAYVYCVEEEEAVRKPVEVGLMNEEYAQILEGLTSEDIVISTWSSQLKDGVDVHLLFVVGNSSTVDVPEENPEDSTEQITDDSVPADPENTEEGPRWELPGLD